jgi:hypothetical protein
MLAVGEDDAGKRYLVERADRLADHGNGIVADFSIRHDVIGSDQIEVVNLAPRHELVDFDGASGLERDVLQLVLGNLQVAVLVDLVALDDVFIGYFLAGLGVDLEVADPVARLVDLVEADLFGFRRRGE